MAEDCKIELCSLFSVLIAIVLDNLERILQDEMQENWLI